MIHHVQKVIKHHTSWEKYEFVSWDHDIPTISHDGSMVLLYMVTWIPSIYPLYVSIYTSTMDPTVWV